MYKANSAILAGRIDLAKKYSNELLKIVPPPKKAAPIKAIEVEGKRAVILPVEFAQNAPVLVEGTEPFRLLLAQNPKVKSQVAAENADFGRYTARVSVSQRATAEAAAKGEQRGMSRFFGWFSGLSIVGVVGIVVLCVFFPALVPIAGSCFRWVFMTLGHVLKAIRRSL